MLWRCTCHQSFSDVLYCRSFPQVDVTVIPDDEIMPHRSLAALTLLQKPIRPRDLAEPMEMRGTL